LNILILEARKELIGVLRYSKTHSTGRDYISRKINPFHGARMEGVFCSEKEEHYFSET